MPRRAKQKETGETVRRVPSAQRTLVLVLAEVLGIVVVLVVWSMVRRRWSPPGQ